MSQIAQPSSSRLRERFTELYQQTNFGQEFDDLRELIARADGIGLGLGNPDLPDDEKIIDPSTRRAIQKRCQDRIESLLIDKILLSRQGENFEVGNRPQGVVDFLVHQQFARRVEGNQLTLLQAPLRVAAAVLNFSKQQSRS